MRSFSAEQNLKFKVLTNNSNCLDKHRHQQVRPKSNFKNSLNKKRYLSSKSKNAKKKWLKKRKNEPRKNTRKNNGFLKKLKRWTNSRNWPSNLKERNFKKILSTTKQNLTEEKKLTSKSMSETPPLHSKVEKSPHLCISDRIIYRDLQLGIKLSITIRDHKVFLARTITPYCWMLDSSSFFKTWKVNLERNFNVCNLKWENRRKTSQSIWDF